MRKKEVFETLSPEYGALPLTDYGCRLILTGLVRLHIHALYRQNLFDARCRSGNP